MNLEKEHLMPVVDAIARATGKRPHTATIYRWRTRGVRGARLETVVIGGRRVTSVDAVRRFVRETTASADVASGHTVSVSVRENEQKRACDYLESQGI
ncbi:MAG: DUF1580 domain-containing protein [Planctomycetota bacterium]